MVKLLGKYCDTHVIAYHLSSDTAPLTPKNSALAELKVESVLGCSALQKKKKKTHTQKNTKKNTLQVPVHFALPVHLATLPNW